MTGFIWRQYLGSLDLDLLGENQVLLYFGVLAIQTLLLPRYQYSCTRLTDLWGVKLTIYGHTIVAPRTYTSQMEAKVWVCREALKRLSIEHQHWAVPSEPAAHWFDDTWNWVALLRGKYHWSMYRRAFLLLILQQTTAFRTASHSPFIPNAFMGAMAIASRSRRRGRHTLGRFGIMQIKVTPKTRPLTKFCMRC